MRTRPSAGAPAALVPARQLCARLASDVSCRLAWASGRAHVAAAGGPAALQQPGAVHVCQLIASVLHAPLLPPLLDWCALVQRMHAIRWRSRGQGRTTPHDHSPIIRCPEFQAPERAHAMFNCTWNVSRMH
jgi:hypothetical protein